MIQSLQGEPSVHAWTVPGVINSNGLGTFFACTNALSSSATIGVEVFGAAGGAALNDASATSLTLMPGATALFGTSLAAGLPVSSDLQTGFVFNGSARVLTTTSVKASQGILCSAFVADAVNAPPTSMTSLTVVRRATQQGN